MKTKKVLALLLALVMCLSLAACGDADEPAEAETNSVTITDQNGQEVSQEKLAELVEAYNAIAVPVNEIAAAAKENGWLADEQTVTELNAVVTTLSFIGTALTEDLTMLNGTDFDAVINSLVNEFPTVVDILSERVSVPYEG